MVLTFAKHYSLISEFQENISFHFLANALLICKMPFEVNYVAADADKSLICRIFIEAEMILFCVYVEFHII